MRPGKVRYLSRCAITSFIADDLLKLLTAKCHFELLPDA